MARVNSLQSHVTSDDIDAVPLRRPGRMVAAVVVVVLLGLFLYGAATNPAYQWDTYWQYLFDQRISQAALVTIELSVVAMAIGLVLGAVAAVMRMSENPVLNGVAWLYIWVFRGTPVYVQLVFWGLVTSIYRHVDLGIPFMVQFVHLRTDSWLTPFAAAIIGLGLNQGSYTAEIMRAGICAVDEGQRKRPSLSACRGGRRPAAWSCPGDAGHHPARRERVHQHAQDHLARHCGALHRGSVLESWRDLSRPVPADSVAARRVDVVSRDHHDPHDRPALPQEALLEGCGGQRRHW